MDAQKNSSSRGDGKVSEKNKNQRSPLDTKVAKKVSPRNSRGKKMKTSDIFLADKTCLFCEKKKCKYAITQSEADPLTPLTSVHGIHKVFRTALFRRQKLHRM
ncbi:hypothetical protein CEXT_648991 [Caerostris extrusa]|uniref:Uncharacterized protein n=1 Tax=Caerostris extrusa TaxID=172846 RepID=A0AAV4VJG6_CAEEX|nr:hypothetical protein CEXT_648991 [Caerostris extrusa]